MKKALKIVGLIGAGAAVGIALLLWLQSRERNYEKNVDSAYAAAKARALSGPISGNPFAKEEKAYPEFEEECEMGALHILHYAGGSDKGRRIEEFELAGFVPAFDKYEIAIYKMVGASGRRYVVGCLMNAGYDWKGTRILLSSDSPGG